MDPALIRTISRAARAGAELTLHDGTVHVRGLTDPALLDELRARRDDIAALLAGNCAACNTEPWINEADTHIPWCRPCANHRGIQLLTAEQPDLLTPTREVA